MFLPKAISRNMFPLLCKIVVKLKGLINFSLQQTWTEKTSGNWLFLWLFLSRRGAQGGRGWRLGEKWGKTVFLLCSWYCLCVCVCSICVICLWNFNNRVFTLFVNISKENDQEHDQWNLFYQKATWLWKKWYPNGDKTLNQIHLVLCFKGWYLFSTGFGQMRTSKVFPSVLILSAPMSAVVWESRDPCHPPPAHSQTLQNHPPRIRLLLFSI